MAVKQAVRRLLAPVVVALVFGTLFFSCGGETPVDTTSETEAAVKPQIGGLVDRRGLASEDFREAVNGFVVQAYWEDLQSERGGETANDNAIDRALAAVRDLNNQNPGLDLRIKLRVYAGIHAPDRAKTLDGEPMRICDDRGKSPACGTVGRFWTASYRDAYQDLQNKLAARYDDAPEILETAITRCTTIYGEPLLRQIDQKENLAEYLNAGYTLEADHQCQQDQIDAHQVWQHTRSSLALNPYQAVDLPSEGDPLKAGPDEDYTEALMEYCRQALKERCVLGNNSIRSTTQSEPYRRMYEKIKELGGPIYFQTATAAKAGDLESTLRWAAGEGAGMVELPSGYGKNLTADDLTLYDSDLRANASPTIAPGF